MNRLRLFIVAFIFTLTAHAHEISAEQSLRKAVEMISSKSYAKQVSGKADFALVHTEKSSQNGKALYYVFRNEKNGGFVITGADHRANTILGYTENGTYEQALTIPAFRSWLGNCEAAMQWLSEKEDATVETAKFNIPDQVVTNADNTISLTIPGRHYVEDTTLPASVEPLLGGIVWNQDDPFNRLCPEIVFDGKRQRCATGCVATAIAQVMKYWEWPKQGTGSNKYTSNKNGIKIELEADFSQSVYDWENMLDDYSESFTDEQANAVAKLMSDVGIGVNTSYGTQSGAGLFMPTYALATYFGYNKGIQDCERVYYTYAEWNDLLKTELAQSRPVLFRGNNNEDSGHRFVVDGYDEDGNYHVNWGWGGFSNGYFDINYMNPKEQGIGGSNGGYYAEQQININCFPDIDGTSVAHYQLTIPSVLSLHPTENTLTCQLSNIGLATYTGQAGYIAMIDNEVVGKAVVDVDKLAFTKTYYLKIPFDNLGVTAEMIGDKKCKIYPVYLDGEEFRVPQSHVYIQDYILLSVDADGNIVSEVIPEDNASLKCESIEITRDYAGYSIKGKAVITNQEGRKDFYHQIGMYVIDDNKMPAAIGLNFVPINAGETREIEFACNPLFDDLEIGKTYYVFLTYDGRFEKITIPGSETTLTMKDPGPEPALSYSGFALDKDVIAPNEELTVSFDVENSGGFGVKTYAAAVFKEDVSESLNSYTVVVDIPAGTTTVTRTARMNFDEGNYEIGVYAKNNDGSWKLITPKYLEFTIQDPATAITNVTGNTNAPAQYYDLQGRRVEKPGKGIYIVNGKKKTLSPTLPLYGEGTSR